jgi:hypothetical protein
MSCRRAVAIVLLLLSGPAALAYTAAGDRIFPATLLLPQAAPADQLYMMPVTVPMARGRSTTATFTYGKTITDDLGIQVEGDLGLLAGTPAPQRSGSGNLVFAVKYRPVLDPPHEFFLTVAADKEFGAMGPGLPSVSRSGSVMPTVYFGKGLGDLDIGYFRPLALIGMARYEAGDGSRHPDRLVAGAAVQYSIPYLQAKVESFDLPDVLRHTTPMVELMFGTPIGTGWGTRTTGYVAPGLSYAGEGWQFGIEALVPLTRASGRGVGILAQLYLSLDYLFPGSIGRPLI